MGFAVAHCGQYDTCNIDFYNKGWECNEENLCYYGCIKGYCWSQCNGASAISWDGPEGTCNTWYNLNENIEWCYLTGESSQYQTCSDDSDCDGVKMKSCAKGQACYVHTAW